MIQSIPTAELESRALTWSDRARSLQITNQPSYDAATKLLTDMSALRKEIVLHHKESKEKAHAAHQAVCAMEKKLLDPLDNARSILDNSLKLWEREQERLRQEKQWAAEREAKRQAEDFALQQAQAAQDQGAPVEVLDAIIREAEDAPAPYVERTYQKAANISTVPKWSAEVTSLKKLATAVADGLVPEHYILPNLVVLNQEAKAKQKMLSIPGVRAVEDVVRRVRT